MSDYQTIQVIPADDIIPLLDELKNEIQKQNSFPEIMTLKQVCEYTQYSRSTILKFVKEKSFPVVDKCDSPRFVKSEVDRWLKGEI